MTDKEIEQAARWCISPNNNCVDCIALHEDSCSGTFAKYIARSAIKEPMIRDMPDYEEDKVPNGVEVLDVIRKALEEHYNIEIMSVSATDTDARLTFAVGELPYTVTFEGG